MFAANRQMCQAPTSADRHHLTVRVLHWSIAVMVIAALVMSTFVMSKLANDDPEKLAGLLRHMGAGAFVTLCTIVRLVMRRKVVHPSPLSSGMKWADTMAAITHRALDLLILVMIVSGIGMALVFKLPWLVISGQGPIPSGLENHLFHLIHVIAASLLALLLVAHALGALYHQFILKDGLLSRMGFSSIDTSK